jgi:putative redox protein
VEITVEHTFTGHGIEQAAVDRALELASTRYCSVSAMLGKTAEIVHTTRIVEAGQEVSGQASS